MALVTIILWFISLAGLRELPPPGECVPVEGPIINGEHRAMCIDEFGTMREA